MTKVFNMMKYKKIISKYDVISFDVFDTLIKRDILNPTDLFKIIETRFNKISSTKLEDFFSKRQSAEQKARNLASSTEVTLDDIYQCLEIKDEIKEQVKAIELETEMEYCRANTPVIEFLNVCRENNKKVIAVSDMYLTQKQISDILAKNQIKVDKIFVSSEYKKNKISSTLFDCVLKEMQINRHQIIHVGDSIKADFLGPLKRGIKAIHIPKKINYLHFNDIKKIDNKDNNQNIIFATINNHMSITNDYYYQIGYEIMGPACLNFLLWINHVATEKNIDNLLFCARDMKLLHEMYNILYADQAISNSYFYVSRKSTYLPYLYINKSFDSFQSLIPSGKRKIKIADLLSLFNIVFEDEKKMREYNLLPDKHYYYEELKNSTDFRLFYENEIIKVIDTVGKEQYDHFMNYLKRLKVTKNTSIVDLGWRGTTQKIMLGILNDNINGLYFGLHEMDSKLLKDNCWAYLFDDAQSLESRKVYSSMSIIELLFSALHGTTLSYSEDCEKPYVLGKSSNANNDTIESLQAGALQFCNDIQMHFKDLTYEKDISFAMNMIDLGTNPTLQDAKKFGDLITENIVERKLASPKKFFYYLFHLKECKDDFLDCEWKIGFLKRLFKIRLNYFKLYELMKKKGK